MITTKIGKETYHIRGDKNQWSVGKVVENKKGEEVFTGEWYYTSLQGLLNNLLERKIRGADANTWVELKQAIVKAKDELMGFYDVEIPPQ